MAETAEKKPSAAKSEEGGGLLATLVDAIPFGKKKKKKSKKAGDVLWTVRLENFWNFAWVQFKEIVSGILSPDPGTRRMAVLFIFSCLGLCTVIVLSWQRYYFLTRLPTITGSPTMTDGAKNLGDFIERQADEAKRKFTLIGVGEFTVELKRRTKDREVAGVMHMAEIEIVAECDSKETCAYVGDYIHQVRNQVTNVFTAVDRDELMSTDGKKKIKKAIMQKMNLWLPKGKIENIYFSKLVLS